MNKEQKRLGNKGFSLVELIVVIAIMAILVAVLAPTLLSKIEESREGTDYSALGELKTAVEEAVLGSETINKEVNDFIGASATETTVQVHLSGDDYTIGTIGEATELPKLTSAVKKVLPALEFKSDAAKKGKVFVTITKAGKVSVKIVDKDGNKDSTAITKKNEDPFEVK